MKKFVLLLVIFVSFNNLFSQNFKVAITGNYFPNAKENSFLNNNYDLFSYGFDFRIRPLSLLNFKTGLTFNYASKEILNIQLSVRTFDSPDGTNTLVREQDIELMTLEVPVIYQFRLNNRLTFNTGLKFGLANFKFNDGSYMYFFDDLTKSPFGSGKASETKLTLSPSVELDYAIYSSISLQIGIEYKTLHYNTIIVPDQELVQPHHDPNDQNYNHSIISDYYIDFDLSGIVYSAGLAYSF